MPDWPERPYLLVRSGETVRAQSYREVLDDARAMAGGLLGLGVEPGERVALLAENRPEWIRAYLAILLAGATVVPLDSLMLAGRDRERAADGAGAAVDHYAEIRRRAGGSGRKHPGNDGAAPGNGRGAGPSAAAAEWARRCPKCSRRTWRR